MSTLRLKAMVKFITPSNAYILENAQTASAYAQMHVVLHDACLKCAGLE